MENLFEKIKQNRENLADSSIRQYVLNFKKIRKLMNINMRIDEQGHIEVESEGDYNKGVIDDCAFTSDPKQITSVTII